VNPVIVDIAQHQKERPGDKAEPSVIHQAIERRIGSAENVQILGGNEEAKGKRFRLRRTQPDYQRLGLGAFLALPVGWRPLLAAERESGIG
jgi:hypothetical protein